MEGVLDPILREMLAEIGGLDRMVTEFVRVTDQLLPAHVFLKYAPELERGGRSSNGTPVFVQLLGGRPEWLAENARRAVELGAPGIDLNFGCPARTVNRHDGGAALLQKPRRLYDVIRAVRAAVPGDIPVTAKVRLGFDHKNFHLEIARAVEEGGAAELVVHARTKSEMYVPPAHWEYIDKMRAEVAIPVLANGDIWDEADHGRCLGVTGAVGVALGRGLVRRPNLARSIRGEEDQFVPAQFLSTFYARNLEAKGAGFAVPRLKQILRYWGAADSRLAAWFNRAKTLTCALAARDLLTEFAKES